MDYACTHQQCVTWSMPYLWNIGLVILANTSLIWEECKISVVKCKNINTKLLVREYLGLRIFESKNIHKERTGHKYRIFTQLHDNFSQYEYINKFYECLSYDKFFKHRSLEQHLVLPYCKGTFTSDKRLQNCTIQAQLNDDVHLRPPIYPERGP